MKTTIPLILAAVLAALAPTVRAADDIYVAFEEGKAAFNAGQLEIAREKLAYVNSKAPDHIPTRAMLAQIEAALGPNNTLLRKTYEKVILPRVEFADVTVNEAMQAVRALSLKATDNKMAPNVIVKDPEIGTRIITLNLQNVPVTEVINYVAQLSGGHVTYDKTAVVITSLANAPRPTTPIVPQQQPQPLSPGLTPKLTPGGPVKHQALNRDFPKDPFSPRS